MAKDNKEQLTEALKEFSDSKHRENMKKTIETLENIEENFKIVLIGLHKVSAHIKKKNMEKAEEAYRKIFVKTGDLRINRALSQGELQRFFDKKEAVNIALVRLKVANAFIHRVLGPCRKAFDIYEKIGKFTNAGTRIYQLSQLKELDGSAEEYRTYFNGISEDFVSITSNLKMLSSALPPGASDYCDFIFEAASACQVAFKIVNEHAKKINELSKKAFDELGKAVMGNEVNARSGSQTEKMKDTGINKLLDATIGKPK
jgi:tetratricopeptide (TPR) repeat protein